MKPSLLAFKTFFALAIAVQIFCSLAETARGQDKPAPPRIIRKSGGVLQASATKRVEPAYPPLAKAAKISGPVVVEITVDEEGNVIAARAISGHPLLKDGAVAAAREWKFAPTLLSGVAVKVIGTITFNFNLDLPPSETDDPASGVPGGVPGGIPGSAPDKASPHAAPRSNPTRMIAGPAGLLDTLERSGFRYSKVSEGIWEIAATGKNIGEFSIRVTTADDLVLLLVKLADRKDVIDKSALLLKLLELNHRFDMARIAISEDMLYARIDARARVTDREEFNYAVEQLARMTDEIYPEIKSFIALRQSSPSSEPGPKPPVRPVAETIIVDPRLVSSTEKDGDVNSEQLKLVERNPAIDSRPVALSFPRPRYTEEARRNKVQGQIRLRILIGADGSVKQAVVLAGLPDGLNQQALDSAYQIKFKPAMKDGKPVDFWIPISMEFNLR